jgi:diacylglycerol kinase family enzyme
VATRRVTLIHNPNAGDDRQPTLGQLEALLKEAGYKVRYQSAKEAEWEKALKRPADIVVVAGGDGTVTKVARRMIGKDVPIAVLPMGTANNISKTLGISDMPVTQLIRAWKSAQRVTFDAGIARGPWGERYFIEGAGVGLLTSAIPKASKSKTLVQLKETDAKVSYAQQLFREHLADAPAMEIKAAVDGEDISGRYLLLEVLNIQYIGPNLFLAPDLVRNDGEFDVVLVSEKHREKLRKHIKHWQEGKLLPPEFETRRGKRIEIRWTGFPLHIDGKVWPEKGGKKPKSPADIEFKVEAEAVRFLVPAEVHEIQELARKNREKGKKLAEQRPPRKKTARARSRRR